MGAEKVQCWLENDLSLQVGSKAGARLLAMLAQIGTLGAIDFIAKVNGKGDLQRNADSKRTTGDVILVKGLRLIFFVFP